MSKVILVRGKPGVGKTTVSSELSKILKIPVIRKDDFYDAIASVVDDHNTRNDICKKIIFNVLENYISSGINLMIDTTWHYMNQVTDCKEWVEKRNAVFISILCICSDEAVIETVRGVDSVKQKLDLESPWAKVGVILLLIVVVGVFQRMTSERQVKPQSQYPVAIQAIKVGEYPAEAAVGGGYFYDDVLEYRVWIHPERGGEDLYDGDDYFYFFRTYEEALAYSKETKGAEGPLVLVRQKEWISEPKPNQFIHMKEVRLTEWKIEWLKGHKREKDSIEKFMKEHAKQGN